MDPFAQATADILETAGVSAVYTPADGGDAINTVVTVDRGLDELAEYDHLQRPEYSASVLRHDAGGIKGVGAPANGDTIEITDASSVHDGQVFTVHEETGGDAYIAEVALR